MKPHFFALAVRIIAVFLFPLFGSRSVYAQFFHLAGFGMDAGYRYNNTGLYGEACYKWFAFNAEYITNHYQGIGFSVSTDYYLPLHENQLMPFCGLAYTRMVGGPITLDWGESNTTNFYVGSATYLIPTAGLRYNLFGYMDRPTYRRKGIVSLFLRMGYRCYLTGKPNVVYTGGDVNNGITKEIMSSAGRGVGGSLGFVIGLGKKELKRSTI